MALAFARRRELDAPLVSIKRRIGLERARICVIIRDESMATSASSTKAVIAALTANSFVTLIKFAAFFLSGSGAMLSEAIHSAADTGNQLLLFIGLRRGSRERDDEFHYGYGGERFAQIDFGAIVIALLGRLLPCKRKQARIAGIFLKSAREPSLG